MRTHGTHTCAGLEISAEAYAEIRAKLVAAEYQHAFAVVDGVEMIDMHGIGLLASAPNANAVERHLVQICVGTAVPVRDPGGAHELDFPVKRWIDLFACETAKEAADFMLTVCNGNPVHVRAVHLRSYATAEELA